LCRARLNCSVKVESFAALGNSLLPRARAAAPDSFTLLTVQAALPKRGERPPITVRVGGVVQQKNLIRKIQPQYPTQAKRKHIQGVVELTVLIDLDGTVLHLQVEGGPSILIPAALDAVRRWVYMPTLLDGRPCYVITRVAVNFTMS